MSTSNLESQRVALESALRASRPHYAWQVGLDQNLTDDTSEAANLFVIAEDGAGRTWQVALPVQRLDVDDQATIVEELVESMDDELGG